MRGAHFALILVPGRHVARPGEKSETLGVELEPEEMEALITKDRPAWEARVKALHDVVERVIVAIDAKDSNIPPLPPDAPK
jgi:hypothetical protein